jgi:predicted Rossmann-fold nucleotide-binding protein
VLDVDGYFDSLLAFLDHMVSERFTHPAYRAMLLVESDPARLLAALDSHRPPTVTKWIDRGET